MRWTHRLAISLAAGVVVFGISAYVGFRQYVGLAEGNMLRVVRAVAAIEAYQQAHHALPKPRKGGGDSGTISYWPNGPSDAWFQPIEYWTDGARYRLTSYGRDRKPGGSGLDGDLSSDDLGETATARGGGPQLPARCRPTFGQFMHDRGGGGEGDFGSGRLMLATCVWAGLSAFLLALGALHRAAPTTRGLLPGLLATIFGTLLIAALYLIPFHLPVVSGH
jgi:hypothetical protein